MSLSKNINLVITQLGKLILMNLIIDALPQKVSFQVTCVFQINWQDHHYLTIHLVLIIALIVLKLVNCETHYK